MIHRDETRCDDNSALPRRMLSHGTSRYEPNSAMRDVRSMYGLTLLIVPPLPVLMGEGDRDHLGPRQVHRLTAPVSHAQLNVQTIGPRRHGRMHIHRRDAHRTKPESTTAPRGRACAVPFASSIPGEKVPRLVSFMCRKKIPAGDDMW
jgi:hypothetical protein